MKLTVKKHSLIEALKLVLPAVNAKSTLPVLSHVLLRAEGNLLTLQATNLTVGITANTLADVTTQGEVCVPARTLVDLINTAQEDPISLELKDTRLLVKWGKSQTRLPAIPAEEFPPMPPFRYEGADVRTDALRKAIQHVAFSASTDEYKPVIQAIQVKNHSLAATDGFRLSVYQLAEEEMLPALIPAEALRLVARMAKDDCIAVRTEPGKIIFTGTGWQLVSQLVDGNFPDYQVIIPKRTTTTLKVSVGALKAALAQIRVVNSPYVVLSVGDELVTLSGTSEEGGEAEAALEAEFTGPNMEIAFNPAYFADSISVVEKTVVMKMSNAKSPAIIGDADDENYTHVLMPVSKGK